MLCIMHAYRVRTVELGKATRLATTASTTRFSASTTNLTSMDRGRSRVNLSQVYKPAEL